MYYNYSNGKHQAVDPERDQCFPKLFVSDRKLKSGPRFKEIYRKGC